MTLGILAALPLALSSALPPGVVVEEIQPGHSAQDAGLAPGDVLVGWERAAAPPAHPESAAGTLASPFDLSDVELEQAPRGPVTLLGFRNAEPLRVAVPPGEWEMTTRPAFQGADLAAYEEARTAGVADSAGTGLSHWRSLALAKERAGEHTEAAWLYYRQALVAAADERWAAADAAVAAARRAAQASGAFGRRARIHGELWFARSLADRNQWDRATVLHREMLEASRGGTSPSLIEARILRGSSFVAVGRGDLAAAEEFAQSALSLCEQLAPGSLDVARNHFSLAIVSWIRGDLEIAEGRHRRALEIRDRLAPGSMAVASSLNNVGLVIDMRGDLVTAEEYYRRALEIQERRVPDGLAVAATLHNLGRLAHFRGDLDGAEEHYRRSLAIKDRLAPVSLAAANSLTNIGVAALTRGDLQTAEDFTRRALAVMEKVSPRSLTIATSLGTLGAVARERGDFAVAGAHLSSAIALASTLAPDSLEVASHLRELGEVERRNGDTARARQHLERALAITESKGPHSVAATDVQQSLGDLALERGDLTAALSFYRRSREIRRMLAPDGSAGEAEACRGLATIERRQGRPEAALESYRCALDALDAQRLKLGGTDEVRTGFGARYASYYRETLDLLVEMDRSAEAFHVLERYRARGLLALLSERDLVFSADVAPELDRERRIANTEYDRTLERLRTASAAEAEDLRASLAGIRRRQATVRDRIRAASPRLAALQYAEPLDLSAARAALDPGTVLLSYFLGEDRSHVFVVGPGPEDFLSVRLDVGRVRLREDVAELRRLLERERTLGRRQIQIVAGRLSDALLRPVRGPLERAQRVLIVPDGPLHLMPFAVLADPSSLDGRRFLAEAHPVHVAASLSVFAELKKTRRPGRTPRVIAFGDPDYSAVASRDADPGATPGLRSARARGLDLRPLPASRGEALDLGRLYGARVYVGSDATEERAKAIGPDASVVHLACHALADETSPLDSSLALTLPGRWEAGLENGLLHAWEIFEQMRIDADLVTLSACGTALGREMSGEGILGLTRAFQYAGARTVLASLWPVADHSTALLMKSFYRYLERGRTKDDALRAAQLDMIRSGFPHPHHWAAFQVIGDWR